MRPKRLSYGHVAAQYSSTVDVVVWTVTGAAAFCGFVVVHEFGHALAARLIGVPGDQVAVRLTEWPAHVALRAGWRDVARCASLHGISIIGCPEAGTYAAVNRRVSAVLCATARDHPCRITRSSGPCRVNVSELRVGCHGGRPQRRRVRRDGRATEHISATGGIAASSTAVAVQARLGRGQRVARSVAYSTIIVPLMLGWIEQT